MTKQRLMLSAAMAALMAGAACSGARAQTTISTNTGTALTTAASGDINIDANGSINIKAASPAVTINSNNGFLNAGQVNNSSTSSATGVLIDTSGGDLVSTAGFFSYNAITATGNGEGKAGIAISGGHVYYGAIVLSEYTQVVGTVSASSSSTLAVQGDSSAAFYLASGTTVSGDVNMGGAIQMTPSKTTTSATGATLVQLEGTINGNLFFDNVTAATSIGALTRGVAVLGPINSCASSAAARAAAGAAVCATNAAGAQTSVGSFVNNGIIAVSGTATINAKGGNLESGSAVVIGASVAGGFVNNGPSTSNGGTTVAQITANGSIEGFPYPAILIDPSASITAANTTILGPVILGPIASVTDSIDPGYSFINRGSIRVAPANLDVSATGVIIQGSSAVNYTQLTGGLLNTGTIRANAFSSVNTSSDITANALTIGSYASMPKIVVAGELTSGTTTTPGIINADVSGPGGGSATALAILNLANVPEVDVLQNGTLSATITSTTTVVDPSFASAKTPFTQSTNALLDSSGSVKTINNAGNIYALNTVVSANTGAYLSNTSQAINLSAGTNGGTTINNSGIIQGDIYFNAGGGGNALNVGNTGAGFADFSGAANQGVRAAQGAAVTNTPYAYASISSRITASSSGFAPNTQAGIINFGSGIGNQLHVGGFGYVNAAVLSSSGGLDVAVDNQGQLYLVKPGTGSVNVRNLTVNSGGTLGLTIAQNTSGVTPVVLGTGTTTIGSTASIGLQFGTFIASGNTLASTAAPTAQVITLISAPTINDLGIANQNIALSQAIPFLFESPTERLANGTTPAPTPLSTGTSGTNNTLLLTLLPRSTGKTNADGTAGLNLSGAALKLFPNIVSALGNDPTLGAAVATSLTVYNNNTGAASGINISASQQQAQQVFSQFAPDVSGVSRAIAVMITDQATGPVAARQRLLRSYGDQDGEMTLWGTEFAAQVSNKGRFDGEGDLTASKDHGFGFSLGIDAGSPRTGWYGGALTFYSGDATEILPRQSKTNIEWYMLSAYSDWHGKHVFLDTKADLGYGNLKGYRTLFVGSEARQAQSKRAALLGALGATTGLFLKYGGLQVIPHVSLDGMTMREEGYTENGGGDGLNLQVAPYYATSLRAFFGVDLKGSIGLWGAALTPEARLGYRLEGLASPIKLQAAFASTGGLSAPNNSFTFRGPDPDRGNALAGFSLGAGTDTWNVGINYDWIRGNNGSTTQIGTFSLLGRI